MLSCTILANQLLNYGMNNKVKFRTGAGAPKIVNTGTGAPIAGGNLSVYGAGALS